MEQHERTVKDLVLCLDKAIITNRIYEQMA